MNETLKGVAHIGAELASAKADLQREMERHRKTWRQLEQVKGLLRRWMSDEALDNPHAIYVASEAALSQQAEPVEPAPAQDEREAFEAWVMQHNTAVREDYDDTDENAPEDIRLDRQGGVYIWANAEAAWFAWKARSALDKRPAQTEQQPSAAQQILDLIMEECRYWHGRDEARRGNFANLYAEAKAIADNSPIAQIAPAQVTAAMWKAAHDSMESDGDLALALQEALNAAHEQTAPQPEQSGHDCSISMCHQLLTWNRLQLTPPIAIGQEYWVAEVAAKMALPATPSPAKRGDA